MYISLKSSYCVLYVEENEYEHILSLYASCDVYITIYAKSLYNILDKSVKEGIPEIRPNVNIPVRVTGSVFENIIIRISATATVFAANAPQRLKKSEVVLDLADNSSPLIMRREAVRVPRRF